MAPYAYEYFKRAERAKRRLTIDMMCKAIGYSERTLKGYISKKYRHHFLHADGTGGYTVNGLSRISKAEFVSWHRQTIKVLPKRVTDVQVVDRYYRLDLDSVEIWLVVAGLLIVGCCWRNL